MSYSKRFLDLFTLFTYYNSNNILFFNSILLAEKETLDFVMKSNSMLGGSRSLMDRTAVS